MKFAWTTYRRIPLLAATLLVMPWGWCGDEKAGFVEFQGKYQTFLKDTTKQIADGYQRRLLELEKAAVQKRDYALAAKIKASREAVAKELDPAPGQSLLPPTATLDPDGIVTMHAPDATVQGGVSWNAEKKALVGWTSDQASARWTLPAGLKTGGYEVELTYATAGGGSFVVKEDTFSLKRQAKDSGSWLSFRPEICGILRVKSASQQLQISASAVTGDGLFYLRQVRLLPCAAL